MNCMVVDDDKMSRAIVERFVEQHGASNLIASCESAIEAANVLRKKSIDLIFLDIEMPEMTGMEFVKSLDVHPQIILVTAKEEYALEAFDIDATDYLLKPVTYARFLKAVQRAQRQHDRQEEHEEEEYVFIKADGRLVKLELAAVRWIEAQGDYVLIHTTDKRYMVHSTMKGMGNSLPAHAFARVHRSYIVRIDKIEDIEDTSIVIGRKVIPIGASYREGLLKRLKML